MDGSSGYLDDASSSSASTSGAGGEGLAPTTLFATLAQRQFDHHQQQMSQAQYDDPTSWSSSPSTLFGHRHSHRHRKHRSRRTHVEQSDNENDNDSIAITLTSRSSQSSYNDTDSDTESEIDSLALQREWEEQLDQLKLMFQIIIFPFVGKFFGRKFGYFLFNRYKMLGSPFRAGFWSGIAA